VLRLFFLSTHYRNPIDYTEQSLENAQTALQKLYFTLERIRQVPMGGVAPSTQADSQTIYPELQELERKFHEAMSDDFNTALGLAALFDLSRVLNRMIDELDESGRPALAKGEQLFASFGSSLGLLGEATAVFSRSETLRHLRRVGLDEAAVQKAIEDRSDARKRKDYKGADEIRARLLEKGVILLDTPNGTTWRTK
jgi:cysteinyl-tRNA synthetase